jgi:hypothetical protein
MGGAAPDGDDGKMLAMRYTSASSAPFLARQKQKSGQLARIAGVFPGEMVAGPDLNRRTVIPTLPSWKEG